MFDFVECVCWRKTELEYKPIYLVDHKSNREGLLQGVSNHSLCIDHHLQKLVWAAARKLEQTNSFNHVNHKNDPVD